MGFSGDSFSRLKQLHSMYRREAFSKTHKHEYKLNLKNFEFEKASPAKIYATRQRIEEEMAREKKRSRITLLLSVGIALLLVYVFFFELSFLSFMETLLATWD